MFIYFSNCIELKTLIHCEIQVKICLVVRQICPGATVGVGAHSDHPPFNIVFVYIIFRFLRHIIPLPRLLHCIGRTAHG